MSWKVTCRDAGDGSGDVILELPDDLLKAAGLTVGDPLTLEPDPADSTAIRLRKTVLCDVCDASRDRLWGPACAVARRRVRGHAPVQVLLRLRDVHAQA